MPILGISRSESVTVSTSAIGITTTATAGFLPSAAEITVEAAAIRFWEDGTDPTATVGHEAEDGDVIPLVDRSAVTKFRAIRRDGADATLRVSQGVQYVP